MPTAHLTKPKYRPEIDGLRAIAVLAVVAYHAFPSVVPGGFAGVDVFFVISGFLITSILLENLQHGTFSLREFYARRVRRIFPALAVVLLACVVAGWFVLDPDDYRILGRHVVAGALFVPNLLLWREAGYFDIAAEAKPLLHLWSLGVEEQFYLLWPLLLWWLWQRGAARRAWIAIIAMASFVACEWLLRSDPSGAFYLPHARFWELLLGALLARIRNEHDAPLLQRLLPRAAALPAQLRAELLAWSGIALVLGSFVVLRQDIPFPGAAALPVVVGTCLLIAAGPAAWLHRRVLSQPGPVFFGLISYPLYLWHWPLLSMARLVASEPPSPLLRALLVLLSVVLAWLTWRLVETPVRSGAWRRWKVATPATGVAAAAAMGVAIIVSGGFDVRVAVDVRKYANYDYDFKRGAHVGTCWLTMEHPPDAFGTDCVDPAGDGKQPLVLVWGDSHAARLTVGLRESGKGRFRVAQFTRDGCRPFLGVGYPICLQSNAGVLDKIRSLRPDYVVLFSFWTAPVLTDERVIVSQLDRTIRALKAAGVAQVIVVGPSAEWDGRQHALPRNLIKIYERKPYLRAPARTRSGISPIAASRDAAIAAGLAGRDDVHYFSAYGAICNERGCMTRAGNDPYDLMTWDYGHLTTSGATYVARRLEAEIGGFAARPPASQRRDGAARSLP